MNCGIVVAAGRSERMGPKVDKAFISLETKPMLAYSLEAFEHCPEIDEVVLVVRKDRVDAARGLSQMFGCAKVKAVVAGGATRQDSVANGLARMDDETRIVSVHDGARPCIKPELISETVKVAKRCGSAVAAGKITDTVKYVERGLTVAKTLDRSKLWTVQTPQTFKVELLLEAYAVVRKRGLQVTDEASAVELICDKVRLVSSTVPNIKVTTADDLIVAAALLKL